MSVSFNENKMYDCFDNLGELSLGARRVSLGCFTFSAPDSEELGMS